VIARYLADRSTTTLERVWPEDSSHRTGYLRRVILDAAQKDHVDTNTKLEFLFEYVNKLDDVVLNFSLVLFNLDNVCIFNSVSPTQSMSAGLLRGRCTIPGGFLNDGQYRIRLMVVKDTSVILCEEEEALVFEVHDAPRNVNWYGKWLGVVRPSLPWKISAEEDGVSTSLRMSHHED
jgi:lipopolysaccharide transport system ATP-binding protein